MVLVIHLMPLQETPLMVMRLMLEIVPQEIRTAGQDLIQSIIDFLLCRAKDCAPGPFIPAEILQPLCKKVAGDLIAFTDFFDGHSGRTSLAVIPENVEDECNSVLLVGNQPARQDCMRMKAVRTDHPLDVKWIVCEEKTPATAVLDTSAGVASIQLAGSAMTFVTHQLMNTQPVIQELVIKHLGSDLGSGGMSGKCGSNAGSKHREGQNSPTYLTGKTAGRIDLMIAIEVIIGYHCLSLVQTLFTWVKSKEDA